MNTVIFEKVKQILVDNLNVSADEIKPESELVNDLGINSLELADLILVCEDKFNIVIEDEDLNTLLTVGDIVNYLEEKVK